MMEEEDSNNERERTSISLLNNTNELSRSIQEEDLNILENIELSADKSETSNRSLIIPETFLRVVSKSVHQRVKMMNAFANYFDELVENENALIKSLNKVPSLFIVRV